MVFTAISATKYKALVPKDGIDLMDMNATACKPNHIHDYLSTLSRVVCVFIEILLMKAST